MVHKQEITPVSNQHLQRREGVYYYRRRVRLHLVSNRITFDNLPLSEPKNERSQRLHSMSALPPKADIHHGNRNVHFGQSDPQSQEHEAAN